MWFHSTMRASHIVQKVPAVSSSPVVNEPSIRASSQEFIAHSPIEVHSGRVLMSIHRLWCRCLGVSTVWWDLGVDAKHKIEAKPKTNSIHLRVYVVRSARGVGLDHPCSTINRLINATEKYRFPFDAGRKTSLDFDDVMSLIHENQVDICLSKKREMPQEYIKITKHYLYQLNYLYELYYKTS